MHIKETYMLNDYDGAVSVSVLEDLRGKMGWFKLELIVEISRKETAFE